MVKVGFCYIFDDSFIIPKIRAKIWCGKCELITETRDIYQLHYEKPPCDHIVKCKHCGIWNNVGIIQD